MNARPLRHSVRNHREIGVATRRMHITRRLTATAMVQATLLWLWLFAFGGSASSQPSLPAAIESLKTNATRSASGQFVVGRAGVISRSIATSGPVTDPQLLELSPALTAVACERIKRAVAYELNDRSPWRGKIYVTLHPVRSAGKGATIVVDQWTTGWSYKLNLPEAMPRAHLIRAVVEVVLLEWANRNATDHSAEIPLWLSEGLTRHLQIKKDIELVPEPTRWSPDGWAMGPTVYEISRVNPRKSASRAQRDITVGNVKVIERTDPLEEARQQLRDHPPLTLQELSFPDESLLSSNDGDIYRNSAHLFVAELLRLPDGRGCLREMVEGLGHCYNWQTAFYRAFHAHFEQHVDLEKWWALTVAHVTSRQVSHIWSEEQSWIKLDEALRTPVEVRSERNALPNRSELSLAAVIRDWDFISQERTLRAKQHELELLRLRVSQNLVQLVDDYRIWLARYLERRSQAGMLLPGSKITAPGAKLVMKDTLREFADLEARRAALRLVPENAAEPAAEGTAPTSE